MHKGILSEIVDVLGYKALNYQHVSSVSASMSAKMFGNL